LDKRYLINEKPFTLGNKYIITDDRDHEEYVAQGKPFSINKHTVLKDSLGNTTYEFYRQFFSLKREFFIQENGNQAYRVFKNRISIPPEIFIESLTASEAYYVKGDFWNKEYHFYEGDRAFAHVTKKFLSLKGSYTVQISDFHNHALVLATVIIIDIMNKKKKKG